MEGPGEEIEDAARERYRLFTSDGRALGRLTDEGVSPGPRDLDYMRDGSWKRRPYAEIASVTLHTVGFMGMRAAAQCLVTFKDGERLIVTNTQASGTIDHARTAIVKAFVADFHRRLVASGAAAGITFHSGMNPQRWWIGVAGAAVMAALLVVLPPVLFAMTGEARALPLLIVGLALGWPLARTLHSNRPKSYTPETLPEAFR